MLMAIPEGKQLLREAYTVSSNAKQNPHMTSNDLQDGSAYTRAPAEQNHDHDQNLTAHSSLISTSLTQHLHEPEAFRKQVDKWMMKEKWPQRYVQNEMNSMPTVKQAVDLLCWVVWCRMGASTPVNIEQVDGKMASTKYQQTLQAYVAEQR